MSSSSQPTRTVFKKEQLRKPSTTQAFTCCASLGKLFFVGTGDGTIIFYELKVKSGSTEAQVEYETTPKEIIRVPKLEAGASRRGGGSSGDSDSITQIVPFRRPRMLLILTAHGNLYFIPNLDTNQLQLKRVDGLKGVHVHRIACKVHQQEAYAALQVRRSQGERQLSILRLDRTSGEWMPAFSAPSVLPDDVHSLAWSGNILVLGFAREYCYFDTKKQEMRSFAKAGKNQPPVMTSLFPMRETLCSLDELQMAIGLTGDTKEAKSSILKTKVSATNVTYAHPYALALAEATIQVHFPWHAEKNRETFSQAIVIKNAMSLSAAPAVDFDAALPKDLKMNHAGEYKNAPEPDVVICITNDSAIYLLDQVPVMDQTRSLYRCSLFDDALLLAELSPQSVPITVRAELALNYANHLISERRPADAFTHLSHSSVSVSSVLKFFPDHYRLKELVELVDAANEKAGILPADKSASIHGTTHRFPPLDEASTAGLDAEMFRKSGLRELQIYLTNIRKARAEAAAKEQQNARNSQFIDPNSSGGGTNDFRFGSSSDDRNNAALEQLNSRPKIMTEKDLISTGDLETKKNALVDTALLICSADREDDERAIELLREPGHRCILEPCARFLVSVGADAVLVVLLKAAKSTERALEHLHFVAAFGRSPDQKHQRPQSLSSAQELSDFFRMKVEKHRNAAFSDLHNKEELGGGGRSRADTYTDSSISDENWTIEGLTRQNAYALVKKYRPGSKSPARLARQVVAVMCALSLAQTQILESSTTRQASGFGIGGGGGYAGGGMSSMGMSGGGGGGGLHTTSVLGANPFQKLNTMWLFTEDALPAAFLCEQLFAGHRPLITPRAISDFGSSPSLRIAFIEHLLELNKALLEAASSASALSDEDLRELHNMMIAAFLDRHNRDGQRDSSVAKKLFDFVSSTHHYSPQIALTRIKSFDGKPLGSAIVDSKAEVLARCGEFKSAVDALFTSGPQGPAEAEKFCRRVREIDRESESFARLLEKSMEKAGGGSGGGTKGSGAHSAEGIREGIRLLTANPWVDPRHIWNLLPQEMSLSDLKDYLALSLQERSYRAHRSVLHAEVLKASLLQRQVMLSREMGKSAEVHSDTFCQVCGRKIQTSLLARFPNGKVVHHACAPDEHVCPVTRENFATNLPPVADAF